MNKFKKKLSELIFRNSGISVPSGRSDKCLLDIHPAGHQTICIYFCLVVLAFYSSGSNMSTQIKVPKIGKIHRHRRWPRHSPMPQGRGRPGKLIFHAPYCVAMRGKTPLRTRIQNRSFPPPCKTTTPGTGRAIPGASIKTGRTQGGERHPAPQSTHGVPVMERYRPIRRSLLRTEASSGKINLTQAPISGYFLISTQNS